MFREIGKQLTTTSCLPTAKLLIGLSEGSNRPEALSFSQKEENRVSLLQGQTTHTDGDSPEAPRARFGSSYAYTL